MRQRDSDQSDVRSVGGEALRQVDLRHVQAGWVPIANVKGDDGSIGGFLGDLSDGGGAAIAVHYAERDPVFVEDRCQGAADGAFLRPDLYRCGLLRLVIAAVAPYDGAGKILRIIPSRDAFRLAGLIDDPFPGDYVSLASQGEKPAELVGLGLRHRADEPGGKELVANRSDGSGFDFR